MKKRYCVSYVGDDSHDHEFIVWAKDHREATQKAKARCGDIDTINRISRLRNPFPLIALAVIILVLVIIQLIH